MKREWNCEISIIDTGILLCGKTTAGEYFGGEFRKKRRKRETKANGIK